MNFYPPVVAIIDNSFPATAAEITVLYRLMTDYEKPQAEPYVIHGLILTIRDSLPPMENYFRLWLSVLEMEKQRKEGPIPPRPSEMDPSARKAELATTIGLLIKAVTAKDEGWERRLRTRAWHLENDPPSLTQIAALQPKAAPPPAKPVSRYDAFCDQCERCRHHHPCAFAKNSSLTCPGPKYRGFTFEAA